MPSRTSDKSTDRDPPQAELKERRRHHRTHRVRRTRSKEEPDGPSTPERPTASTERLAAEVVEPARHTGTFSPLGSRTSLPYPSFSKAHSREAVDSRENLPSPARKNIFTPDPTDLQHKPSGRRESAPHDVTKLNGPPSPPLTAEDHTATIEEKRRSLEQAGEDLREKLEATRHTNSNASKNKLRDEPAALRASPPSLTETHGGVAGSPTRKSRSMTPTKAKPMPAAVHDGSTVVSAPRPSRSASPASSSKTSIAPQQPKMQTPFSPDADDEASPTSETAPSPRTPTQSGTPFSAPGARHLRHDSVSIASPMPPPPPPPPPVMPIAAPRVDYLMQNGGLPSAVTKHYLLAPDPQNQPAFATGELPDPITMSTQVEQFFSPFRRLLDDYSKVMSKNGSIAVATGYRSIARRLLDRLEAVFARDISFETCTCYMCAAAAVEQPDEEETGVSWGEILEYVSGRQELPQWPPFMLHTSSIGLGISAADFTAPMQKLDIDVPEEYREHYIRQSKKTKQSVDRWLARQTDTDGPPDEADDDTLTFAILTHLGSEQRAKFSQLLGLPSSRPPSTATDTQPSNPLNASNSEFILLTGLAIQRLYRLPNCPRLPECALYLLKNQPLHNVLATLAAISDGEWDILISGRFDGFLRSGADDLPVSNPVSPVQSRGPTPGTHGQTLSASHPPPTPGAASSGAPVALDEETEIAALAEVEREIFQGMEALEDAFESLHLRAETVRRTLRERGAGLAMQAQIRKGAAAAVIEARLGTPGSVRDWDSEGTDDGIDDSLTELAPDDSASNVSRSRIRRPRRRTERRTPQPVEEENEEPVLKDRLGRTSQGPGLPASRNALRKR